MTHWLFIDVPNLAWRHFHALDGNGPGSEKLVLAGMLDGIKALRSRFNTDDVAFCFDVGVPKRRQIRSTYKHHRYENNTPSDRASKALLQEALSGLRADHLPTAGFKNVFGVEGYEADDVVASLCDSILKEDKLYKDTATIVSNDRDFWQLLFKCVIDIWNHKELITEDWFRKKFAGTRCRLSPSQWPEVKAMAGDVSDCIYGIDMVGETKAVQFLRGELPKHHLAYKKLVTENARKLIESNLELIELPFYGCPKFKLRAGGQSEKKWKALYERLGIGGMV